MPERHPSHGTVRSGNPGCGCGCGSEENCCAPRCCETESTAENELQRCCDQNGCCCLYPAGCRNPYWPEFTHPRWLCCKDLYSGDSKSCYDCCADEEEAAAE